MRSIIKSLLILILVCVPNMEFAQDRNVSVGPAPNQYIKSNHTIFNNLEYLASIAYGHEWNSRSTISMPIPAGTPFNTLNVFNPSAFPSSMTKGGDGNYYLTTHEPALYQFNPVTGSVTLLGSISGMGENLPNGITYNPANNTYYIITSLNIYSFNVATRVATFIGNMGISNSAFVDLCFNDAGSCYAYDIYTDASYIINPTTGVATLLGPLGYSANYGQGMSYDMETNTIYLSAYNNSTTTGQLRIMDPGTGATTLITDWGNQQIAPFALNTQYGSPCTITAPSNPNPPDGVINIPVTGNTVTWINGSGTESNELWFGSVGNVAKVYDGSAITSYTLPILEYDTKYLWWVVSKNTTCRTQGLPWTFTTTQDPNQTVVFYEPFNNTNCWTQIGPLGQGNWSLMPTNNAGGSPPTEMDLFYNPTFNGLTQIISCPINSSNLFQNTITWKHYFDLYLSVNPVIGVAVSYDGGNTSSILWEIQPLSDIPAEQRSVTFTPLSSIYQIIFYLNGNSFNINQWDIDDIQIDYVVPVELISFTANSEEGIVELNWLTATETNNSGFEVQRSNGNEFETIAFIAGHGTTTEMQAYSYSDRVVNEDNYNYRLKQINYDGSFEYSNIIEIEIQIPSEFKLEQNFPNPFNPSTSISFRLATDSKVSLKVFDLLGQEVATLLNKNMTSGTHNVGFDASELNSGMYIYRIETTGIDGTNFSDLKKMLLVK